MFELQALSDKKIRFTKTIYMKKFILAASLLILAAFFVTPAAVSADNGRSISDVIASADNVAVIKNGERKVFDSSSEVFISVTDCFCRLLENCREMPCFGVSIDKETRKAMNRGYWLEFCYGEQQTYNGMTFDALVLAVMPEYRGFNLIRANGGKYEGRCYHIELEGAPLDSLYAVVKNTAV